MADETKPQAEDAKPSAARADEPKAERKSSSDVPTTKKEFRDQVEIPVDRLIEEAYDFFGHEAHVVAGAVAWAKVRRKHLTLSEAEELIKDFLAHEVEGQEEVH